MNKERIEQIMEKVTKRNLANVLCGNKTSEVDNEILELLNEVTRLTNNWNALEEIILKEIEKCEEDEKIIRQNKIPKFYDIGVCAGIHGTCKFILDKMKEIKEGKNESK